MRLWKRITCRIFPVSRTAWAAMGACRLWGTQRPRRRLSRPRRRAPTASMLPGATTRSRIICRSGRRSVNKCMPTKPVSTTVDFTAMAQANRSISTPVQSPVRTILYVALSNKSSPLRAQRTDPAPAKRKKMEQPSASERPTSEASQEGTKWISIGPHGATETPGAIGSRRWSQVRQQVVGVARVGLRALGLRPHATTGRDLVADGSPTDTVLVTILVVRTMRVLKIPHVLRPLGASSKLGWPSSSSGSKLVTPNTTGNSQVSSPSSLPAKARSTTFCACSFVSSI
mmetsp:Transcript_4222/g.9070  ORF Transcript_4222/g.9070 Transcript_4222/m.9070 type:complete len:286 (+) Transcript_4222:76-933(+)